VLDGYPLAAFKLPALKHQPAGTGRHPGHKTMNPLASLLLWLVRSLRHNFRTLREKLALVNELESALGYHKRFPTLIPTDLTVYPPATYLLQLENLCISGAINRH
jgi:hypothetical protein